MFKPVCLGFSGLAQFWLGSFRFWLGFSIWLGFSGLAQFFFRFFGFGSVRFFVYKTETEPNQPVFSKF
jgi:hypothetical protein